MKRLFRLLTHLLLLLFLVLPLVANKGCGKALEDAEGEEEGEILPAGSEGVGAPHTDKGLPVLPAEDGSKLLEGGGPKVESAPLPE